MTPPPARRDTARRFRKRSVLPRLAILGSLAAATTIVPLNGPPALAENHTEGVEYGMTDVLDVLAGTGADDHAPAEAQSLAADPLVGVRAAVTASRAQNRATPSCGTLGEMANGSAAAAELIAAAPDIVMPLAEGTYRTTSHYGYRTLWGRYGMHSGLDFGAPAGTPIHAIADGVVEYTGPGKNGRSSMLIIVRHDIGGQIVRSWYVHMYSNGVYTSPGQHVKVGDVIGAVGSNGNSTGPHLHLEIHLDDNLTTTDPAVWLASNGAVPLDKEIRDCLAQ